MPKDKTYHILWDSRYYIDMALMLMDLDGGPIELKPTIDVSYDRTVVLKKGDHFESDVNVNFMWRPHDEVITVTADREIFPFDMSNPPKAFWQAISNRPEESILYAALREEHANLFSVESPMELFPKRISWFLETLQADTADCHDDEEDQFNESFFLFYNRVLEKPNTLHADAMGIIETACLQEQTSKNPKIPSLMTSISTIHEHSLGRCLVFPCTCAMSSQLAQILGTTYTVSSDDITIPITQELPAPAKADMPFRPGPYGPGMNATPYLVEVPQYNTIKENLNEKFGYWKNAPSVLAACSTFNRAIRDMNDVTDRHEGYMSQALVLLDPGLGTGTALNRSSHGRQIRNACYLIHLAHRIAFQIQTKLWKYRTEDPDKSL